MAGVTQPLRDEHRELFPHVEVLRTVADSIGRATPEALRTGLDEACDFLTGHLIPHATAEDEALYPVVGRVMGAPRVTATMSRDHVEVGRLAAELVALRDRAAASPLSQGDENDLRRVLYGLYALVKVHFAKEEEIYLPLLDERLSPDEASAMFEALEQAAGHAKGHH
jgi:iron-sulfur cluster repair protein YtfE (RIC family)